MSPGLGFFYSGLLRRKNALSQLYLSLLIYSMAAFTWCGMLTVLRFCFLT